MKPDLALTLSCGMTLTAASPHPKLQRDPDTISTCREWFNNAGSDSCESIRSLFGISPEGFHKWNPSVGVDCKPWSYQSYCILTKEKWASFTFTRTTADATINTTSSKTTTAAGSKTTTITGSEAITATSSTTTITTPKQSSRASKTRRLLSLY